MGGSNQSKDSTAVTKQLSLKAQPSNEIVIDYKVWRNFRDFNGKFEYYIFQTGSSVKGISGKTHRALCVRRPDTGSALRLELTVVPNEPKTTADKMTYSWVVLVCHTEWKPQSRLPLTSVRTSTKKWHAAKVFQAFADFSKTFGEYKFLTNNCIHFAHGFRKYMKNYNGECEMITDYAELQHEANEKDFTTSLRIK